MPHSPLSINARFLTQPQTGVQRYSLEVLNALDGLLEPGEAVAYCPPVKRINVPWKNIQLHAAGRFRGNRWEQIDLTWLSRGSLLFSPANIGPILKHHQVVTIHDTSVFAFPQAYTFAFRLKYQNVFRCMARTAKHVFTVSDFSKRELQHWLQLPPECISVVYEGNEHLDKSPADSGVLERLLLAGKPFFIVIGSNSLHKNLQVVLEANKLLAHGQYDIVVITGDYSQVFQPTHLEWAGNVKRCDYVTDHELGDLYHHALGLIFPSLYEGFGLPLVEAMANSCPVICSDIPSSREVCAESALFFDPLEPRELSAKMQMLMNQPGLRADMIASGLERSQGFSWKKAAQEIKLVLDRYI